MSPEFQVVEVRREALSPSRVNGGVGAARTDAAAASVTLAAQAAPSGAWSTTNGGDRVEPSRWFG